MFLCDIFFSLRFNAGRNESRAFQDLLDDYRQSRVVNLFDSSQPATKKITSQDKKIPHAKQKHRANEETLMKKKQMRVDQGRISCVKFMISLGFYFILFLPCFIVEFYRRFFLLLS